MLKRTTCYLENSSMTLKISLTEKCEYLMQNIWHLISLMGGLKKNQLHNHSHDLYSVRCKPSSVVYRLCEVREHLKKKTAYIFSMMMAEWWHLENEMLVVYAHALVPNCHMKCTKFFFHRKIFDVSSADELLTYLKQSNESFLNKRWKA